MSALPITFPLNRVPLTHGVRHASELFRSQSSSPKPAGWTLKSFVGKLSELSCVRGAASLTLALHLVHQAQLAGEPVAWIGSGETMFFGPDAQDMGIDLGALPVIWAKDVPQGARHADKLLRSGAFGLVILDMSRPGFVPAPLLGRLVKLAEKHRAGIVFLTRKKDEDPSIGSLISWRGTASWERVGRGQFAVDVEVLKDKRHGPGHRHREVYRGPLGMR